MAQLQAGQRAEIKGKNFAIPGKEKYPIHDVAHARNALVRVRQFGSPSEKSRVYSAVTKQYPALATRSSVVPQKLQRKAERKAGVGKGQESMKLEAPKQKLSSVMIDAFVDEVKQIEKAAEDNVVTRAGEHVGRHSEKLEAGLGAAGAAMTAGGLGQMAGTARAAVKKYPKQVSWMMNKIDRDELEALADPRVRRVAGKLIRAGRKTGFKAALPAAVVGAGVGYGKGLFRKGYRKGQVESVKR